MDKIIISGLEFHAHTGITEPERQAGQRYSVDLEIMTDLRTAGVTDNLNDAIDYSAVCDAVVAIGSSHHFALAETLAESIANTVLGKFPAAEEVMVRAKKLHPPVPAITNYFGVEIRRTKDDVTRIEGFLKE